MKQAVTVDIKTNYFIIRIQIVGENISTFSVDIFNYFVLAAMI